MVQTCIVPVCPLGKISEIKVPRSFHNVPKYAPVRERWLSLLGVKDEFKKRMDLVCSLHFHEEDYQPFTGQASVGRRLKPFALPTRYYSLDHDVFDYPCPKNILLQRSILPEELEDHTYTRISTDETSDSPSAPIVYQSEEKRLETPPCCVPVCPFLGKDPKYMLPMPTDKEWFELFKKAIPEVTTLSQSSSKICNFHFKDDDFNEVFKSNSSRIRQMHYLKPYVVPTRYLRLSDAPPPSLSHVEQEEEGRLTRIKNQELFNNYSPSLQDSLSSVFSPKDEEAIIKYVGNKLDEISKLKSDLKRTEKAYDAANSRVASLTKKVKRQTELAKDYATKLNSLKAQSVCHKTSNKLNQAKIGDQVDKQKYDAVCLRLKYAENTIDSFKNAAEELRSLREENKRLKLREEKYKAELASKNCTEFEFMNVEEDDEM